MPAATQVAILRTVIQVLGFAAMLTPLILWVAWSEAVFYGILVFGACTLAGFAYCNLLLYRIGEEKFDWEPPQ